MDDATYEKMKEAQAKYRTSVMAIPGVHATGIGLKTIDGKSTDTFAIVVFVLKKKPLNEIPLNERVATEYEGFPIDVIESDLPEPLADENKYRPVEAGCQIGIGNGYGTLGCFVKDKEDESICILSNQHVLQKVNEVVFQSTLHTRKDEIGRTKRVVYSQYVDGGIASFVKTKYTPDILEIGYVQGAHKITQKDVGSTVRKRGRTTGLTTGVLNVINYYGYRADGSECYDQLAPTLLTEHGDSGSVVVNDENKIIGMVWGKNNTTVMVDSIDHILSELNIELVTPVGAEPPIPYGETTIGKLESFLRQSARGKAYWETFSRCQAEVTHIFHDIPRLHAIWLNLPLEGLQESIEAAAKDPNSKIPTTIGGHDTIGILARIRKGLLSYAKDEDLKRQATLLYDDISNNIGRSWREAFSDRKVGT
jgi:hypothetical protein